MNEFVTTCSSNDEERLYLLIFFAIACLTYYAVAWGPPAVSK